MLATLDLSYKGYKIKAIKEKAFYERGPKPSELIFYPSVGARYMHIHKNYTRLFKLLELSS